MKKKIRNREEKKIPKNRYMGVFRWVRNKIRNFEGINEKSVNPDDMR